MKYQPPYPGPGADPLDCLRWAIDRDQCAAYDWGNTPVDIRHAIEHTRARPTPGDSVE